MTRIADKCRHFKEMLIHAKDALLHRQNLEKQIQLDPNNKNKIDPNDTVLEALAEARTNFDPIDTEVEIKTQLDNEPDKNRPQPG
jgi:hypothetical protein